MNEKNLDPYVYIGANVLKNKFDIKNQDDLNLIETAFFRIRLAEGIPQGHFDYNHYKRFHYHIFQDVYEWAGTERTVAIAKGESLFAVPDRITPCMNMILDSLKKENYLKDLSQTNFTRKLSHYFNELNAVHPFREGNGRTLRLFVDELAEKAGYILNWEKVERGFYIKASIDGFDGKGELMVQLFNDIVVSKKDKQLNKSILIDKYHNANTEYLLNDNLKEKILNYIDSVEQYDFVLNKIYQYSISSISDELTLQVHQKRDNLIKFAQLLSRDDTFKELIKNINVSNGRNNLILNISKIKSNSINGGRISSCEINMLSKHINTKIRGIKNHKKVDHSHKK